MLSSHVVGAPVSTTSCSGPHVY